MIISIALVGCGNTNANHIGNPLTWPISGLTTSIENSTYNHKRGKVKAHVTAHFLQLKDDTFAGGGPLLRQAMDIAKVPTEKRASLISELKSNPELYFTTDQEPLVVALMVNGN